MGDLIRLSERMEARRGKHGGEARRRVPRPRTTAEFVFDLGDPFTYLAAEALERAYDQVVWTPASAAALQRPSLSADAVRRAAEERAAFLRQRRFSMIGVPDEYSPGSRIECVTRLIAVTMTRSQSSMCPRTPAPPPIRQ